jgi:hypothetical protein
MGTMTPEDWAAAATAAKAEYEQETRDLVGQLERGKAKIARLEKRLTAIHDQYRARVAQLGAALLGLPPEELPPAMAPAALSHRQERRRGSFDEPVLALAREISSPDVTSREIVEAWNQRNPDQITESTMRSILERLLAKGSLRIAQEGGGKGSGIPRKYRPV